MLDKETTNELLRKAKENNCDESKTRLLSANAPLIKSIVKRYIGKGVDYDDLYQLGCLGFVKAINKFDASYSVKFTTYAVPLIAGEIKRFLRDDGTIKVSRSVKALYVQIKRYLATKTAEQHQPTIEQIATDLGSNPEDVIYAMEAANMPLALFDSGENQEGLSIADRLASPESISMIDKLMLKNLLASLTERERKVILLRYFRNQTQSQVAKQLGISQVQVSRMEQKVLQFFRTQFAGEENSAT